MLDFYLLGDSSTDINSIKKEDLLGSLSLEEHKALQHIFKNPLGVDIHPFQDTRLYASQVQALHQLCVESTCSLQTSNSLESKATKTLLEILQVAVSKNSGLVSFCD